MVLRFLAGLRSSKYVGHNTKNEKQIIIKHKSYINNMLEGSVLGTHHPLFYRWANGKQEWTICLCPTNVVPTIPRMQHGQLLIIVDSIQKCSHVPFAAKQSTVNKLGCFYDRHFIKKRNKINHILGNLQKKSNRICYWMTCSRENVELKRNSGRSGSPFWVP